MVKNKEDPYSRRWIFTINNYIDTDIDQVRQLADKARYIIAGYEVGKECGTPHIQGFVYFKTDCSFSSIKKKLPRAHIIIPNGNDYQQFKYCSKDGNLLIEQGDRPQQGKRNDVANVTSMLKEGANIRQVIDNATSYQSIKIAEIWLKYNEKGRDFKPEVRWYHGSTGTGKTKAAIEWLGEDYYVPVNFKWWEGYDAHENVLLDDIRKDYCKFHELLKLLDRYKYRVECKGGSRQLLAKRIAITSCYDPYTMYNKSEEDLKQLIRRIDEVNQFGEKVEVYDIDSEIDLIDP